MKKTMQLAALSACLLTGLASASVKDLYVAQSANGGGSACSSAMAVSSLASAWSANVAAGTTVHLCGNITTPVILQSSGTAGNPVTLKFEPGASMASPVWTSQGAIQANGLSYIVIDGNGTAGISNTANGSALANKSASTGISMLACNNCEVRNLPVVNLYVHSSASDTTLSGADQVKGIYFGGANVAIHGITCHDVGWCLLESAKNGDTLQVYNSEFYNMDHGIAFGAGPNMTVQSVSIYGNHFHDMANWDTGTADAYHHDGVHGFSTLGTGVVSVLNLYSNVFDGNEGNCCVTSWVFLEGGTSGGQTPWTTMAGHANIFNNVFVGTLDLGNGQVYVGAGTGHMILGNTFLVAKEGGGSCLSVGRNGPSGVTATIANNVFSGCDSMANVDATVTKLSIDYNLYAHSTGAANAIFVWGAKQTNSFTQWQSMSSGDAHSINGLAGVPALSAAGVPQAGFAGAGKGANLSAYATGVMAALASDIAGNARGTTWDMGAYSMGSVGPAPTPVPDPTPTPVPVPTPTPVPAPTSVTCSVTAAPVTSTVTTLPWVVNVPVTITCK